MRRHKPLRRHIPWRQGADRSSTKANFEAEHPAGRRPCVDRTCRPNIGCCRLRAVSEPVCRPAWRVFCVSIEMVVAAKPWPMILRRRSCANYQSLVDCNSGGLPFLVGVRSSKKTRSRASSVTVSPAITSATNGGWGAV